MIIIRKRPGVRQPSAALWCARVGKSSSIDFFDVLTRFFNSLFFQSAVNVQP